MAKLNWNQMVDLRLESSDYSLVMDMNTGRFALCGASSQGDPEAQLSWLDDTRPMEMTIDEQTLMLTVPVLSDSGREGELGLSVSEVLFLLKYKPKWEVTGQGLDLMRPLLALAQTKPMEYLLVMEGDCHPELRGPFTDDDARVAEARRHRLKEGDEDGLYRLDVQNGVPEVYGFTGGVLDSDEEV